MKPDFTVFQTALDTALRLTRSGDQNGLTELLEATKGRTADDYNDAYRPYYAASRWLQQHPQFVVGTKRVDFRNPANSITDLMLMQAQYDDAYNLLVPPPWRARRLTAVAAGVAR
jgi:hypothetical protein